MFTIAHLTDEERTQIIAALAFWKAVAATSQTHPSRHPEVAPLLANCATPTIREVELLMRAIKSGEDCLVTASSVAKKYDVSSRTVSRAIAAAGLEPVVSAAGPAYRWIDVQDAMQTRGYDG